MSRQLSTPRPFTQPVSTWDVLEEIKRLALEEPKRICMNAILCHEKHNALFAHYRLPLGFPPCGTVGCVAGWGNVLLNTKNEGYHLVAALMGLDCYQTNALFFPATPLLCWQASISKTQTPEYAARVVQHITNFQLTHEKQLKEHMCQPMS